MSGELDRYYLILGLEPNASGEEVRTAYRDCVDAWHPDRFSHAPDRQARAQTRLRQINEAYGKLRRRCGPTSRPRTDNPRNTNGGDANNRRRGDAAASESTRSRESQTAQQREQHAYRDMPPAAEAGSPSPPTSSSWLELTNEGPLTVSALYFSGLGILVASGCGLIFGGIYGGPIGALGGLLGSLLAGVSTGGLCGALSAMVARKVGGPHCHQIGGAVATLVPGAMVGTFIVWSVSHVLVTVSQVGPSHLAFGGGCGGVLGATLGGWTGKAVAEALERNS